MQLPPGWTEDDMKACMAAGTPGEMHALLARDAGTWRGKTTMWMGPGGDPMTGECKCVITSELDGRFMKSEIKGEMPGMGPYHGLGYYGFDNVAGQLVATWLDNHGTGIMNGTGELSADRKSTTWNYTFNCPITQKPARLREVETITGPKSKTFEMFGEDPKSGKEYRMMRIEFEKR
jgi:hypothetical protein